MLGQDRHQATGDNHQAGRLQGLGKASGEQIADLADRHVDGKTETRRHHHQSQEGLQSQLVGQQDDGHQGDQKIASGEKRHGGRVLC